MSSNVQMNELDEDINSETESDQHGVDGPKCELCEKRIAWYCSQCDQWFCNECKVKQNNDVLVY